LQCNSGILQTSNNRKESELIIMEKPQGYDESKESLMGGFDKIPEGAYKFKILRFDAVTAKTGAKQVLIKCDIAQGNYQGTFEELSLERQKDMTLKIYQCYEGNSLPFFKGIIISIEKANPGFKFDFSNEHLIVGKIFYGWLSHSEKWYDIENIRSSIENVKAPVKKETAQPAPAQPTNSNPLPF
jgi:hypothetical protein